jgi:DNA-binding NtrC family response regulator
MAHDWPGNVRELENVIERAFILCRDSLIDIAQLPEEFRAQTMPPGSAPGIKRAHALLEAQSIRSALQSTGFNRAAAAQELGIHKTTLYRKIKRLGIRLPQADGRSRNRPRV